MYENCNPSDCPVNAKVDALKERFDAHLDTSRETHQKLYDKVGRLEESKASMETTLKGIDEKLDKLISWREELDDKPNKFLDSLKSSAAWMVLAAVIGIVLGKIGL